MYKKGFQHLLKEI